MKKKINLYLVERHYCTPRKVFIFAETKKKARKLSRKQFGSCDESVHRIKISNDSIIYPLD